MSEALSSNSRYPINAFASALETGRIVADGGGATGDVSKASIADALKSSDKSGAFLMRLASARVYGIIIGSRNGYRLSEEAKKYFFPASDAEKRNSLLVLLKTAPIFADIIKRFDGTKLPPFEMFPNVLMREFKVPADTSARMARFFLAAAQFAGVLDAQGYLRYVAARQSVAHIPATAPSPDRTEVDSAADVPANGGEIDSGQQRLRVVEEAMSADGDGGVWRLNGTTVRIETSGKLSEPLWNLLNGYVQALKPSREAKSK